MRPPWPWRSAGSVEGQAMKLEHRTDIASADDVALLVREFYTRVYDDDVLRPMFAEVAGIDLEEHLPKMERFWGTVLFGQRLYQGNPMSVHRRLDSLKPLKEVHFIRWLSLFRLTVDRLFAGPTAERAKQAAAQINHNIEATLRRQRELLQGEKP